MRRKVWLAVSLAGVMVAFGAGLVVAAGGDHPRGDVGIQGTNSSKGKRGGCGMATRTLFTTVTPDDDDTAEPDNSAIQAAFRKTCRGPVVVSFQAEVSTAGAGFLHADAYARCQGTGGIPGGCSPGVERSGSPGHVYLQNAPSQSTETHGMNWVFHELGPGVWQYRIGVGSQSSNGTVEFRSLVVEAFQRP
jgi:hypothetical protein